MKLIILSRIPRFAELCFAKKTGRAVLIFIIRDPYPVEFLCFFVRNPNLVSELHKRGLIPKTPKGYSPSTQIIWEGLAGANAIQGELQAVQRPIGTLPPK